MNDAGLIDARLLELYGNMFEVLAVALVAGVVLVLLAQVAVTALCCWETMRSLRERKERRSAPVAGANHRTEHFNEWCSHEDKRVGG